MTLTVNIAQMRAEIALHLDQDRLIRGTYWDGGKGCFIGCLTHSNDPRKAEARFGLTVPIMRIAENIFEAMPDEDGRAFFAAFGDAVGEDGKDLSRVHWAWLAAELRALPVATTEVQAVIDPVIAGLGLLAAGKDWPKDAAAYAAYAAAYAAYATDAAAYAAAYAAARKRQAATLIRLIEEAPKGGAA